MELTHFNDAGRARMVDVSAKDYTVREAVAEGRVKMLPETLALIKQGRIGKGDVLAVAQVAGIMGAKNTWQLIPMCHPLPLSHVDVQTEVVEKGVEGLGQDAGLVVSGDHDALGQVGVA